MAKYFGDIAKGCKGASLPISPRPCYRTQTRKPSLHRD